MPTKRNWLMILGAAAWAWAAGCGESRSAPAPPGPTSANDLTMRIEIFQDKIVRSDEEWRKMLTPEQFRILRRQGTEMPFTGRYWNTTDPGVYRCAGCGQPLFTSRAKFDSHCGWPAFDRAIAQGVITEREDRSHGMVRTEIICTRCGSHLGHLFDDGPTDTGLRYCVNSASLDLEPTGPKPPAQADPSR